MTLTDASVFISFLRTRDPKLDGLIRSLPAAACGPTRAELRAGARTPASRAITLGLLSIVPTLPIPEAVWDMVGENIIVLARARLTVPFPDVVVATLGIALGLEVWARDHHFPRMQAVLPGLRLFVEPP